MLIEKLKSRPIDDRREIIVPGDDQITLIFCVEHFIALSKDAIKDHGAFFVALSGGSTPKALFKTLTSAPYDQMMDWPHIHLFWSDERSVLPTNPESNYCMAMQSGLEQMPIPKNQIHRMCAEEAIEDNALAYERQIQETLKDRPFDLIMLGLGEDGHTASLFPGTEGLDAKNRLVIANYIPQKSTWRMTLTYECINQARHIAIYVLGPSKKTILAKALVPHGSLESYPIEKVGTPTNHALWIADQAAAEELTNRKENKG